MSGVLCQECKEVGFTNLAFGRCKYCKDETTNTWGMPLCLSCFNTHRNVHRMSAEHTSGHGRYFNRGMERKMK